MITVHRKNYVYKFDGTTGSITNDLTGSRIDLKPCETKGCNGSNIYLDRLIADLRASYSWFNEGR